MLCQYLGQDTRSYPDYKDALTGRMLEAAPGNTVYDIHVAPGRAGGLPLPPGDGRWAAAPARTPAASGRTPRTGRNSSALPPLPGTSTGSNPASKNLAEPDSGAPSPGRDEQ